MVNGVVDFATLWRLVASGIHTMLVACDDGSTDVRGHGALAAPNIKDLAVGSKYDSAYRAITGEAFKLTGRKITSPV